MWGYVLKLSFSIAWLSFVETSKYNLDAESQKLFGEDLKGALKRFRKSYEYLKILQERSDNIQQDLIDSYTYNGDYFEPIINQRIKEMLGIKDEDEKKADASSPSKHLRQDQSEESVEMTDVQLLDAYVSNVARVLTVPEINSFANLGFEFAGKIIHAVIGNLGGSTDAGDTDKYSKLSGGDLTAATTHTQHKVTSENSGSTAHGVPDKSPPSDSEQTYRAGDKSNGHKFDSTESD